MNWLEHKYVGLLSNRLENFKRKGPDLYNFRCPLCGDSEHNRNKSRGYIYNKKGRMRFHCHNCGATAGFTSFLKGMDINLYNEFQLEKLREEKTPEQIDFEQFVDKMKKPNFMKSGPLKGLKKISQLSADNNIKKYIVDRCIPTPYHAKLFVCPQFMHFTNNLIPNKFDEQSLKFDETRLLIPYFNNNKEVFAYQGRSFKSKSNAKYITILLDETKPAIYGLDTANLNFKYYVFEGPIDSMFIPNSIAATGGDTISKIIDLNKENAVIVYDNECRNIHTINKIDKAIMNGYKVCIWPESNPHKDINDMIKAGLSADFIKYIIDQNTFKDLAAKMALTNWRKA